MLITILGITVTFGIVVLFHELGHFMAAKGMGVRVEKFSMGFGPEWFGFTKGKTRYKVCLFPLGGYVKMYGEDPGEGTKGEPDEYLSQKWWKKMIIVCSGSLMNFVLAVLIFTFLMSVVGVSVPDVRPVVGSVAPSSPADTGGIKEGDVILSVGGEDISTWNQMADIIHANPGKKLKIVILRGTERLKKEIVPAYDKNGKIGLIGIVTRMERKRYGIFYSLVESVKSVTALCYLILHSLWLMITGKLPPDIAGPVGIAQIIGKVTKTGWLELANFIGVISVNLGLFNLFPIPLVDGGHILTIGIEAIRGKSLPPEKIKIIQNIGILIILAIFIFATYQDMIRLFVKK